MSVTKGRRPEYKGTVRQLLGRSSVSRRYHVWSELSLQGPSPSAKEGYRDQR